MTIKNFLSELEGYYGNKLPEKARLYTENYLNQYNPDNLKDLLMVVLMYHPLQFHTPAMAIIEKAHGFYHIGDKKNEIAGHKSLKINRTVSATRPIVDIEVITDEERQEVLDSIENGESISQMLKTLGTAP